MRAYFFNNMYLSSIQQGIQSAHTLAEMFLKYEEDSPERVILYNWADEEKTMIVLNAGYSDEIASLSDFFANKDNLYPFQYFYEPGIDNALTSVGIILPEKIYEVASENRKDDNVLTTLIRGKLLNGRKILDTWTEKDFSYWELDLIDRLPNYPLAR